MSLQSMFRNGQLYVNKVAKIPVVSKVVHTGSMIKGAIQSDAFFYQEYNKFLKGIINFIGNNYSPKTGIDYLEHFFYYLYSNCRYDHQAFAHWSECRKNGDIYQPTDLLMVKNNGKIVTTRKKENDPRIVIFNKKGLCGDYAALIKDFCKTLAQTKGMNIKCDIVDGNDLTHSWNVISECGLTFPFDISNYLQFNKKAGYGFVPSFDECINDSYKNLHVYPRAFSKKLTSAKVTAHVLNARNQIKNKENVKSFK